MKVVRDDLWLCADCLQPAVNGDFTSIDYYYSGDEAQAVYSNIEAGLEQLGPHLVPDFDSETEDGIDEFSRVQCDCCGTHLAGSRHRFAVLGED